MRLKNIVAIIRESVVASVLDKLQDDGVPGVSVTSVRGYGEYINTYSRSSLDALVNGVRLEIILPEERVESVVDTIMDLACSGAEGDGIVAVFPVERLYRVRDKQQIL